MAKTEYKKKDIIVKLMQQIYAQVDEIRYLKQTNEFLIKEKEQWQKENQKA
jgi:hypothetical protein